MDINKIRYDVNGAEKLDKKVAEKAQNERLKAYDEVIAKALKDMKK